MTTVNGSSARPSAGQHDEATVAGLVAQVAALADRVAQAEQQLAERSSPSAAGETLGDGGQDPLYADVEAWVQTYLLPTFPRPYGAVGMTRWYWCVKWWEHDEAVTRLMALWYAWESARLEMTGMVGWLQLLDHNLPILCGEDGPFRGCHPGREGKGIRHQMPPIAGSEKAPPDWWNWWN